MGLFDYAGAPNVPQQTSQPMNTLVGSQLQPNVAPMDYVPDAAQAQMTGPNKPGFLDRLLNRVMPTPQAYQGLLSPDQIQQSRRRGLLDMGSSMLAASSGVNGHPPVSAFSALGSAQQAGLQGFDQNNQNLIGQGTLASQVAQQQHILQVRKQAQTMFAPPPGVQETQQQILDRQSQLSAYLGSNGDYEGAKGVADATAPLRLSRAYGAMGGNVAKPINGVMFDPNVTNNMGTTGGFYNDAMTQAARKLNPNAPPVYTLMSPNTQSAAVKTGEQDTSHTLEQQRTQLSSEEQEASGFRQTYKTLTDNATAYTKAQATLSQLDLNNPASLHAVAGVMASLEPMKPQLRQQMLGYMATLDPGVRGRILAWFDTNGRSQLPPEQIAYAQQALNASVTALHDQYAGGFGKLSPGAQKRLASQSPDVLFHPPKAPAQQQQQPGAGSADKVKALLGQP